MTPAILLKNMDLKPEKLILLITLGTNLTILHTNLINSFFKPSKLKNNKEDLIVLPIILEKECPIWLGSIFFKKLDQKFLKYY